MDERLNTLLTTPGISGFEDAVRDYISGQISALADPEVDNVGNLIARFGKGNPTVLLTAHMDEIGFLTTEITDDGFVRFRRVGTIDEAILPGTMVTVHGTAGDIPGVIGIRPPHLGGGKGMDVSSYVIDVGVSDEKAAWDLGVSTLTPVTFRREPRILNEHRINCRTLDDRFGCYVLLSVAEYLASLSLDCTFICAWTVQEEVGLRGARAIASEIDYDIVLPIDAYATAARESEGSNYTPAVLGGGPVLRRFDHGSIASGPLSAYIQRVADRHKLPLQQGATGGETDGVPLQEASAHMVPIAVAMRYLHSLAEMADARDIETTIKLLKRIVEDSGGLVQLLQGA